MRQLGTPLSQTLHLSASTAIEPPVILLEMKFYRIDDLPPYVFATVDQLKRELRREGHDVVDLGFGNPDLPSPAIAVEKLREAARRPANHRYSASRGIEHCARGQRALRAPIRRQLDPETAGGEHDRREGRSRTPAVGARGRGDTSSCRPRATRFTSSRRDSRVRRSSTRPPRRHRRDRGGVGDVRRRRGRDRLVPAQPDDGRRDAGACSGSSTSRASASSCSCTTSRTPTSPSTATTLRPCSQAEGADECAVELYSLTKSFSMAGWRVGFVVGRAEVVAALAKLKSYLDYGTFQPIQIAATVTLREAADYPRELCEIYRAAGTRSAPGSRARAGTSSRRSGRCSSGRRCRSAAGARLPRGRASPGARGERRGQPRHRLRRRRRGPRALRADRERAADRPGDARIKRLLEH